MFRDITAPYHLCESWLYDRAVAPAVADMLEERPGVFRWVLEAMPSEGRLLDVGCGGGHLLVTLACRHPSWRLTGVDLSCDQVHRAERRARDLDRRPAFIAGSALELPFDDGSFDAAISVCSIKHWPDPAAGLAECLRVLRPGGVLAVIEVERNYRREDRRAFIARQRVPFALRPAALAGFAWKIAARSPSLAEAKALFGALPAMLLEAGPVPGMPLWMVSARKTAPGPADDQMREKSRVAK